MAVKEFCVVPSYVEVVSMASSDSGRIMIAYQMGEEGVEFCYAEDFIERMQTCRYVDTLTSIIREVINDDGVDTIATVFKKHVLGDDDGKN